MKAYLHVGMYFKHNFLEASDVLKSSCRGKSGVGCCVYISKFLYSAVTMVSQLHLKPGLSIFFLYICVSIRMDYRSILC
jgi:hypothetical protein